MHPNSVDLYGGLYGLVLVPDSFDIGHGAVVSRTYAHFMAPFMMAFKPAPPGRHHPAPWKPAKDGIYIDITSEVYLPAKTAAPELDRVNTIWWIAALMRLKWTTAISVPVVSSERFASIPEIEHEPHLWPIEIHTPRLFPEGSDARNVDLPGLEWLRSNWYDAALLMGSRDFSFAMQAVDGSLWNHTPELALIALWGALERLFSSSGTELSFRVSTNIVCFLEPPGRERYACFKKVKVLYDNRSKAAHGTGGSDPAAYGETYEISKRVLLKIIESRRVPGKKELEANVFGDHFGIAPDSVAEK